MKNSKAAVASAIYTVIFITAVTVGADLWPALKEWLKITFTHHWIGKSILAVLLYFGLYALLRFAGPKNEKDLSSADRLAGLIRLLNLVIILGTVIIFGFFWYEAFVKL